MIAIVDYGRGNLFSLAHALHHVGAESQPVDEGSALAAAKAIILPGVGAFADAMTALRERGFVEPLRQAVAAGTPLLGICLGMQVLAETGDEFGSHDGLGLIPGAVRRLPAPAGRGGTRIPNVGWRQIDCRRNDPLLEAGSYYFVHSYAFYPAAEDDLVATIPVNGSDAPAVVRRGSAIGCQFHPERSGPLGLRLLARFAAAAEENMNERESCNVGG